MNRIKDFLETTHFQGDVGWDEEGPEEEDDESYDEEDLEKSANTVAIVLKVPENAISGLPLGGFEEASDLHVTLLVIDNPDIVDPLQISRTIQSLGFRGMDVECAGIDRFSGDDGADAMVIRLKSDELENFRETLAKELTRAGLDIDSRFPEYKPHITVGYVDHGEDVGFGLDFPDVVRLKDIEWWGESERIPLLFKSQPQEFSREEAKEIGDEIGLNWDETDIEQFAEGLKVEMEHKDVTGGDLVLTAKIAAAHLREKPNYYSLLSLVEKQDMGVMQEAVEARQKGLIPKSGDWQHPYRWIKPEQDKEDVETSQKFEPFRISKEEQWNSFVRLVSVTRYPREKDKADKLRKILDRASRIIPPHHMSFLQEISVLKKTRDAEGELFGLNDGANLQIRADQGFATFAHEVGHSVDFMMMDPRHRKVVEEIYNYGMANGESGFPTDYSKSDPTEFFAECYQFYFRSPKQLMERNPAMAEFLDYLFKSGELEKERENANDV